MKHPYNAACTCKRCLKESKRRIDQSNSDRANDPTRRTMHHANPSPEQQGQQGITPPGTWLAGMGRDTRRRHR